jgi:hypothetical protein
MREREVTEVVAVRLRKDGAMNLTVRTGYKTGPDIECELPHSRRKLYVEAKGSRAGSESQACRRAIG